MKLGEFINELKHKSLNVLILMNDADKCIFNNQLSVYQNWIHKNVYNDLNVISIYPSQICKGLIIVIDDIDDEVDDL